MKVSSQNNLHSITNRELKQSFTFSDTVMYIYRKDEYFRMVETGCKLGVIGNYKGEGVSEASICIEKYQPKLTISRNIVGGGAKRPPV